MFANFLIGLREGLEAALVVSILVAYLVKTERRGLVRYVWVGVSTAVGLSLAVGALLTFGSRTLTFEAQEAFGGFMSIIAVGLVTWMIFWMALRARDLRGELHAKLDGAIDAGRWAIGLVAFVAVLREGLETALFLWSAIRATGGGLAPLLGAALGLATAVVVGNLIYRGALRINLRVFFTWTGAALVVVAGGVLAYGVHDLQEAGILPGLNVLAFDVSETIPPGSWYGTVLKGVFNFSPATTVLELFAWLLYVIPTMSLFFWTIGRSARPRPAPASAPLTRTGENA
jgi:high-affinity iron transporter